ncbi:MAG: low molecular weight phosphotyrosine protein phosphatase, partial [Burkholderiaceae bacterium]
MMTKILFVCMGNICRSPTAEGIFRTMVRDASIEHLVKIDSAGTHAFHVGEAPDPRAQAAAKKRGIDISMLRARQ